MRACSSLAISSLIVSLIPASLAMGQLVSGYTVFNSISGGVNGELHVPANYDSSKSYPVVVFFHGDGQIGTDNIKQTQGISNLYNNAVSNDFFLYCPQTARPTWGPADDLLAVTQNLARMTTVYNIDPNRMYATGLSLGGGGADGCVLSWPNVFAAFVPLSAYPDPQITPTNAAAAVGRPMWFVHGNADGTVGVQNSRNSVNYILAAQGQPALTSWASAATPKFQFSYNNLNYTEYNGVGHDTWSTEYSNPAMYSWMLKQKNTNTTLAQGKSINISFTGVDWSAPSDRANVSASTKTDSRSQVWNLAGSGTNTGYNDPRSLDNTVAFAQDTTGKQTIVNLAVSKSFYGGDDPLIPHAQQSLSTTFDPFVTQTNWRVTSSQGELTFSGLTPGGVYDLSIFASINDTDGSRRYFGKYAVGSTSLTFDASQNLSSFINLNGVTADASGNLALDITPTNGSRYAVISAVTLTAVPEPTALSVLAVAGGLLMRRRPAGPEAIERP